MISWELAIDRYGKNGVTRFYLEMLAIMSNPRICDAKTNMVKDVWGSQ